MSKSIFTACIMCITAGVIVFMLAATSPARPLMIVVRDDPGGNVGDYLRWYERVQASGVVLEVDGACVSACTLILSIPKPAFCVTRNARFGFHLASVNGAPDPAITDIIVKMYYPVKIQEWIEAHGPLAEAPIYLSGDEMVSMGAARYCHV